MADETGRNLIALDLPEWDRAIENLRPSAKWNERALLMTLARQARTEIRRLRAVLDEVEAERDQAQDEWGDLRASLSAAEAERDRARRETEGVREELARTVGELDDVRATRDRLAVLRSRAVELLAAAYHDRDCPDGAACAESDQTRGSWYREAATALDGPPDAPAGPPSGNAAEAP